MCMGVYVCTYILCVCVCNVHDYVYADLLDKCVNIYISNTFITSGKAQSEVKTHRE